MKSKPAHYLLIITAFIVFSKPAFASWTVQQHTASIGYYKNNSLIVFIISYNPLGHCRLYEAGLAILEGNSYGEPIKQKKSDLPMMLNIGGNHYGYTGYITKYSNGIEKTIPITKNIIDNIKSENHILVKLDHKSPELLFSLENANQAINQAEANCLNSL